MFVLQSSITHLAAPAAPSDVGQERKSRAGMKAVGFHLPCIFGHIGAVHELLSHRGLHMLLSCAEPRLALTSFPGIIWLLPATVAELSVVIRSKWA